MAKYGCAYAKWAPFKESGADESASAFPKYGTPLSPGKLVKVTDSPSFNEAKAFGDNALAEYVNEFKECGVNVEVTEIANAVASAIFGATIDGTSNDLEFSSSDNAPYGGLAFYTCLMDGGKKYYQGVYYPKLKAAMTGTEYATKGESITLATGSMNMVASAPANGKWKVLSERMDTEAEAKAWVDGLVKASA